MTAYSGYLEKKIEHLQKMIVDFHARTINPPIMVHCMHNCERTHAYVDTRWKRFCYWLGGLDSARPYWVD